MKSAAYNIGLTLVILGFIICIISFYFLIFGVPIFLIGATLIFISKKTLLTKFTSILVPIILWLPATWTFLYFNGMTTPETYLIPKDFHGSFRIIYGEECGIVPIEENGRRIFEIPDDGILIIKNKQEAGWIDNEYYLVDKSGNKIKVPMLYDFTDMETKKTGVYMSGTGASGGPMSNGGSSTESPLAIHYSDFFVASSDTSYNDDYDYLDSLTEAKVDLCRRKK